MKKIKLSPSLMVGNLLNLESDITELLKGKADMLHLDMIDTTIANNTGLPAAIVPALTQRYSLPLDIHIASRRSDAFLSAILPFCSGSYVSLHSEYTDNFFTLSKTIRNAGGKPGIAINCSTSVDSIKHLVSSVDMIMLLTFDAGGIVHVPGAKPLICEKITQIKQICASAGRDDILIECDGGITAEDIALFSEYGADTFVLGRDSIYGKEKSISEMLNQIRSIRH